MKSIKFIIIGLFLSIGLSAQITFAEKVVEKPGWDYLRDAILAPYDSSHINIQIYPLWEAYKKYIGQQLFFVKPNNSNCMVKVKRGGEISRMKIEDMIHKYYDIVDVVCAKKSVFSDDIGSYKYRYGYFPEGKTDRNDRVSSIVENDNQPCFILKDTQSTDTVYLYIDMDGDSNPPYYPYNRYITLVGGFLKYKEKFIGQDFVCYDRRIGNFGGTTGYYSDIRSIWQCIDVSVATHDYFSTSTEDKVEKNSYSNESLAFVLRNKKDTATIGNLVVNRLIPAKWIGDYPNNDGWATEQSFRVYENKLKKIKQQLTKKEEQKRQGLVAKYGATTADKILAGKYEIGMSKAVCKEIAGYATVVNKTAATETWQIYNIWIDSATYLYFAGDKLVKIVNL